MAIGGDEQVGGVGRVLADPISIRVVDESGNGVAGVQVSFTPSDQGSVSSAVATTDGAGFAETLWTLGPIEGTQTLSIRGAGTMEFTAQATNGCDRRAWPELSLGSVVNGALSSAACVLGGGFLGDLYLLRVTGQQEVTIQMTASHDAFLFVGPASDLSAISAIDDDGLEGSDAEVRAILTSRQYVVYASNFPGGGLGSYTLSVSAGGGESTSCPLNLWLVSGVTTAQRIDGTDCVFEDGSLFDIFSVVVPGGATLRVNQRSIDLDPLVRVFNENGAQIASDDNGGEGSNAQLDYQAGINLEIPFISAGSAIVDGRGPYTLNIAVLGDNDVLSDVDERPDGFERVQLPAQLLETLVQRKRLAASQNPDGSR